MKRIILAGGQETGSQKFISSIAEALAKDKILVETHFKTDDKPPIAHAFEISGKKPNHVFDIHLKKFKKNMPNHQRGIMIYCQQANMEKTLPHSMAMVDTILEAADRAGYGFFAFEQKKAEYMVQPYKGGFIKLVSDISEMYSRLRTILRASGISKSKIEPKEEEIKEEIGKYLSGAYLSDEYKNISLAGFLDKIISDKIGLDDIRTKVIPSLKFFSEQVENHMFLNVPVSKQNTAEKIFATGISLATFNDDDVKIFEEGVPEGIKQIIRISNKQLDNKALKPPKITHN